mmetsp:Transcript_4340/g.5942  ORF Transcript_4340/g.5942 Transcript_4340/m.5942 type:complete len:275 (-) Transcript_4340:563-1387(-)
MRKVQSQIPQPFIMTVACLVILSTAHPWCQPTHHVQVAAFSPINAPVSAGRHLPSALFAKKTKKKKSRNGNGAGAGFGVAKKEDTTTTVTISADKNSLEKQWDTFASVTNLEIAPKGNPDDDDYQHFICADVFVRIGSDDKDGEAGTGWYRTGKVVAVDQTDLMASLTLQKGLIFWTAVHMWPALAAKGKAAATLMQLGYMPPTMYMADETEGALDDEEGNEVIVSKRVSVQGVSLNDVGFRPDFNPPGFTYKRRERAAMKKKKSSLEEIAEVS